MDGIKALAFDTGGTILDWHSGIVAALAEAGTRRGVAADWHAVANDYRRHSLRRMLAAVDPGFTIDWVHRAVLDDILPAHGLAALSGDERDAIVRQWHALEAWPDFLPALESLRRRFACVSFTILSLSLVIDVSRRNGIVWDAVIACEMLRIYKTQPEAYRRAAAHLALRPDEILMVACHNFDLDGARREGYRTAFVRRPQSGARLARPIRRRTRPVTSSSMVSPNLPAHWFDNRTELAREAVQFNLLRKSHRPKTTTPNILLDNQQIGRRELADWYCECAHRPPPLGSARDGYERPEELELRVGLLRHGMMQVLGWHSFRGAGAMRDLAVVVY